MAQDRRSPLQVRWGCSKGGWSTYCLQCQRGNKEGETCGKKEDGIKARKRAKEEVIEQVIARRYQLHSNS
jgi:hypothetical protein